MGLLIFYLLLALVVSFFCSILEAVLLSVTPSFIQSRLSQNKAWARQLLSFKSDIDRPLAAILSLNTISHTVGAAGVGAQAGIVLESVPMGVVSGVLTLLILIFSELIPKTLGASYWKSMAFFTTKSLQVLTILMYPLVLVAQGITKLLKTKSEPSVERSEIVALADLGLREGVFSQQEARILKNLISLRKLSVRDVMTPRMVMVAASEDMTVGEFNRSDKFYRFSRIPLYKDSIDLITGFVHKHDVLTKQADGEVNAVLSSVKRDIAVVPDNQSLFTLYSYLTSENAHIAVVVEEFGGTAGLVTMEDVLETLLGLEIMDEYDHIEDLQEYARKRWKERAERLGIEFGEMENPGASTTGKAE